MKIGILTVPFNNNYGGYLQACALMHVLAQMGHQPCMIMRRHDIPCRSLYVSLKIIMKSCLKAVLYRDKNILLHPFEAFYFVQGRAMQSFVTKFITPQTPFLYTWTAVEKKLVNKFDAIIVGSDQVWRPIYVPQVENYFLSFAKDWKIRRVVYAASFGTVTPEYTSRRQIECSKLLQKFDAISVRELGALDVFRKFGWQTKGVKVVLDPTLLINPSFYGNMLKNVDAPVDHHYAFSYILDCSEDKRNVILNFCKEQNLFLQVISDIQSSNKKLPSVESWLKNIKEADYVITDSFHGMVFSIIFHVPFIVLVNKTRGTDRFESLLNSISLINRICYDLNEIDTKILQPIDWERVDTFIQTLRDESLSFLSKSLQLAR